MCIKFEISFKEVESQKSGSGDVRLLGPHEVAKLCVGYGLSEWVLTKAE